MSTVRPLLILEDESPEVPAYKQQEGNTNARTPAQQSGVVYQDRKVYVDTPNVEEKNIITEAMARISLLVLENRRLKSVL